MLECDVWLRQWTVHGTTSGCMVKCVKKVDLGEADLQWLQ